MKRIGIFGGTFSPLHEGHIAFCLAAQEQHALDEVWLLPEERPRNKSIKKNITKRIQDIEKVIQQYEAIRVVIVSDAQFTVRATLPKLQAMAPNAEFVLLIGSDVMRHMIYWPDLDLLLDQVSLIVGLREYDTSQTLASFAKRMEAKTTRTVRYEYISTMHAFLASSRLRHLGRIAGRLAVDFSV